MNCSNKAANKLNKIITSGSTTKSQPPRQYCTGTKTEIYINGKKKKQKKQTKKQTKKKTRKPRDKPTHLWTPYLRQRRQEYTMEKRQSL